MNTNQTMPYFLSMNAIRNDYWWQILDITQIKYNTK